MAEALGLRLGGLELSRLQNSTERMFDRIRSTAWGFSSSGNYGFNSYARTELTLRTLEALVGPQTLARALRTYHERFRFRHPSSDDFYAVVSEVAGRDVASFFAQTTERPGILDDEVSSAASVPVHEPRGVFGEDAARKTVTQEDARQKEKQAEAAGRHSYRSTVMVRRRGEVALPTSLRLEYEGGEAQTLPLVEGEPAGAIEGAVLAPASASTTGVPWRGRFRRIELTGAKKLVSATIDPDDRLLLDVNRLNNSRRVEPDSRAAARWGTRLVFWLQQLAALAGL
jgi:hypothetical protein